MEGSELFKKAIYYIRIVGRERRKKWSRSLIVGATVKGKNYFILENWIRGKVGNYREGRGKG